ncbi:MAG TPA: TrmO family methyltransferase [Anaeromyxobacteraceae bacterium]|nr:TrmO family methyltransferase [Anaeromyxobacteraceae bacterium]
MPPIVLETVAVVRSPYKDAASVPGGGACVRIEVDPRFERELEGVERSSHLIVVGYFHERGKGEPAAPRRWRHGRGKPCGAFASRCPDRPTPISMSVGRFLGRDGLALLVDHIDLVDGTPVLDLKPYVPGWDAVFSARRLRRVRQVEISDLDAYEFLALDLENHLGSDAALPPAKMALAAVLLAVKRLGLEPRDPRLTVSVNRCDVTTDALMGLLGATLGSGRVEVGPEDGAVVFRFRAAGRLLEFAETRETAASVAAMPGAIAPVFATRAPEALTRNVSGA